MHIRKYGFDYGRRALLEKSLKGGAAAGVLTGLWPMLSKAMTMDATKAYPEDLLSIEAHTKGKVKPGDVITADNVEHVEHLLDPIALEQVKNMGRRIKIRESTKDVSKLFQADYLEATLRNQDKAKFDDVGNVRGPDGGPWIGGNPFPDAQTGAEAFANLTLSWGRHNYSQYAVRDWDIGPDGNLQYQYDFVWAELNTTARVDGSVWRGEEDKLRYQSVWFTAPNEQAGTSFLNTWYYDQRQFPDLVGYLPAFKRVREYPTNQRFEPLVPGITVFLSDAWAAGDPMLTWGNYKIVERKPMLGAVSGNWHGERHENWHMPVHGGPKDQTFFDIEMELVPETAVVEAEPTGYPRSPVGKKRVWIDVRNQMYVAYVTYDRKGNIWKSFEPGYSQYVDGDTAYKASDGNVVWSWTHVMSHDFQSNRMSRFIQAKEVSGGYPARYETHGEDVYNKYLTTSAMRRLGA
ncbi:hypothetical protein PC39_15539 [Salinisphaera sp. PC39]|uniref:DUF1329 domain-containing protein n=1 Tax=Salinisphaera sp. PC39 TaxID=1304156 RepID=UPI00333FBB11